jgi:predicted transcriptional regulator
MDANTRRDLATALHWVRRAAEQVNNDLYSVQVDEPVDLIEILHDLRVAETEVQRATNRVIALKDGKPLPEQGPTAPGL